jgi:hypothetical protein
LGGWVGPENWQAIFIEIAHSLFIIRRRIPRELTRIDLPLSAAVERLCILHHDSTKHLSRVTICVSSNVQ